VRGGAENGRYANARTALIFPIITEDITSQKRGTLIFQVRTLPDI